MTKLKIGVLHETKIPPDRRVAITPKQGRQILELFPNVELYIQPSNLRAYKDEEYLKEGLSLKEEISDCDILIGVKEVSKDAIIHNKKYLFFAHVAKKQAHNKDFLSKMIDKKITLFDYEYLTDYNNNRLVAFGKWAGIVGAYNALRAEGLRNNYLTELKATSNYKNKAQMFEHLKNVKIKARKIVITGGGRVARGAEETLQTANVKQVSPTDFLTKTYTKAVYTKLEPIDYVKLKTNSTFDLEHFFKNPSEYVSIFEPYTKVADIYIPCHYWNQSSPVFFTKEQAKNDSFNIKIIADVSCDISKPVPSTLRASTISEPFYDYNPFSGKEEKAFSNKKNISVMAIDNLPGELPRDASDYFGSILIKNIFPYLFGTDSEKVIERATILNKGKLTDKYKYLQNFVDTQ